MNDNRILATAAFLADTETAPTILVTKDLNLQLKARALGLEAEDYRTDRVDDHDIRRTQRRNGAEEHETSKFRAPPPGFRERGTPLAARRHAALLPNHTCSCSDPLPATAFRRGICAMANSAPSGAITSRSAAAAPLPR